MSTTEFCTFKGSESGDLETDYTEGKKSSLLSSLVIVLIFFSRSFLFVHFSLPRLQIPSQSRSLCWSLLFRLPVSLSWWSSSAFSPFCFLVWRNPWSEESLQCTDVVDIDNGSVTNALLPWLQEVHQAMQSMRKFKKSEHYSPIAPKIIPSSGYEIW